MSRASSGTANPNLINNRIVVNADFDLFCRHHDTEWCTCIYEFVLNGRDTQPGFLDGLVRVPMMPTKGWWIPVYLHDDERTGYKYVMLEPGQEAWESLGTLLPGEGRAVIRSILVDWIRGRTNATCTQRTHGYHEDKYLSSLKPGGADDMLERWSMISQGACTKCLAYLNPEEDVPEDVKHD